MGVPSQHALQLTLADCFWLQHLRSICHGLGCHCWNFVHLPLRPMESSESQNQRCRVHHPQSWLHPLQRLGYCRHHLEHFHFLAFCRSRLKPADMGHYHSLGGCRHLQHCLFHGKESTLWCSLCMAFARHQERARG